MGVSGAGKRSVSCRGHVLIGICDDKDTLIAGNTITKQSIGAVRWSSYVVVTANLLV